MKEIPTVPQVDPKALNGFYDIDWVHWLYTGKKIKPKKKETKQKRQRII